VVRDMEVHGLLRNRDIIPYNTASQRLIPLAFT
jgi:hypothetical protein